MAEVKNYFVELNSIDVNEHIEKKSGLSYLSWAWAWAEIKKVHPNASYKVYERDDGVIYWTDGKTCWVKTSMTINDIEYIEYLPILDYSNKSILLDKVTSFDVNKSIQRSLTKCAARHGLGLYIYAGEDLPEQEKAPTEHNESPKKETKVEPKKQEAKKEPPKAVPKPEAKKVVPKPICTCCACDAGLFSNKDGRKYNDKIYCNDCIKKGIHLL